jgi:hypothetical protein
MILQVALGIVLGFALLAILPLVIIGSISLLRWLVPLAVIATAISLLVIYPSQVAGSVGVLAAVLACAAVWLVIPSKLQQSNVRLAQSLSRIHVRYVALLDNKPPFQGPRWWPLRVLATCIAIVVVGAIAAFAFVALEVVWHRGA